VKLVLKEQPVQELPAFKEQPVLLVSKDLQELLAFKGQLE
jgi:hypothetical protein